MFLLALLDFSRVFMFQQLVINAAREGCRYAVVSTSTVTTGQIQTYVTNYLCGQQINNLVITVYEADPTTGANLGAGPTPACRTRSACRLLERSTR